MKACFLRGVRGIFTPESLPGEAVSIGNAAQVAVKAGLMSTVIREAAVLTDRDRGIGELRRANKQDALRLPIYSKYQKKKKKKIGHCHRGQY